MRQFFIGATLAGALALAGCAHGNYAGELTPSASDLAFGALATTWDEGIPLGNGTVGALVWQKDSALRLSLDRTDLWDLRPSDSIAGPNYSFEWVRDHIRRGDYGPVQDKFDAPYDLNAAPSKIPGAALEFPLAALGEPDSVHLYINDAVCEVRWPGGTVLRTFVSPDEPVGRFVFTGLTDSIAPVIVPPVYAGDEGEIETVYDGSSLTRLGYEQGTVTASDGMMTYHQPGWGDFAYDVAVCWKREGDTLTGTWSVTSTASGENAEQKAREALATPTSDAYKALAGFWGDYWAQSSVTLPDTVLQKQYDNEMYKFGAVARENSCPISLQGVWTADNGKLPPWKGDFHHDLNTQLSYWPAYTGNHLREGLGYLNTLWDQRDVYRLYTRQYFGTDGMNVPGVATYTGEPMGGWIQYSMSQTTGAWLAQHFYLHWLYSADRDFLATRAYPFAKEVATYLEQQSRVGADGVRTLEFSSSPEYHDNSLRAWFPTMTNYDLALMKFIFGAASEMAGELGLADESARWAEAGGQLPAFDLDAEGALTIARGEPYTASHRHFSHAMAIHPLGLIDASHGPAERKIIDATIAKLDSCGPDYWTGYSYSWLGNMKARAHDGEGARDALRTFAECFCLANTFHANGDQSRTGKSRFTYRPFTLEGNFAFASGIQEMLLQSHTGTVVLFPAIPDDWTDVSFDKLRARGGFLISARREGGKLTEARAYSEQGGKLTVALPDTVTLDIPAGKWVSLLP